jgi:2-polyprenyl-3-methyl-5-hydroxy-6-metoxy-1,4-benzoquinol methylase
MGMQNIFSMTPLSVFERKFLIGFCFMVRREALEKAGGIDDAHTVADDFDMSIRLRKNGYRLLVDKRAFVYHHGFTTGNKVYGDFQKRNGWNSFERYEMGNHYIIGKHGFRSWAETMHDAQSIPSVPASSAQEDHEGVIIRKMIGEIQGRKILDVGCGHNKTIPEAIGIDMVPKDEVIEALVGSPKSVADIVADVSEELPIEKETIDVFIARHILEHMMDSVGVLRHWIKTIKTGGKMIIAVPNNGKILSIPMNSEHVHAWNPQSLQNLLSSVGLKNITHVDAENGVSFITSGEKA